MYILGDIPDVFLVLAFTITTALLGTWFLSKLL
jgi:cytochrome oxidase assembly protein ShyY1